MFPDPQNLRELVEGFSAQHFTPEDYLDHCLRRIADENPKLRAVLDVYVPEARTAARAATQRYMSGKPLSDIDGVPIGVKANIAVKGHVWHGGIKAYTDKAAEDAAVVQRLRAGGAIILCSLNMEEGALGAQTDNPWFGKTHNPLRHGFTAGGSSGGSAAAVAANLMPVALGTDTMGSVRIPSAYCGIAGFKPTQTLMPMQGVMPLSRRLDVVGVHSQNITDARIVTSVLSGIDMTNTKSDMDVKIGVMIWPDSLDIEPDVADRFQKALNKLQASHSPFARIDMTDYDFSAARRAGLLISEYEGAQYHAAQYEKTPEGFSEAFMSMLNWAVDQPPEKHEQAEAVISSVQARAAEVFQNIDILIAPTAPQTAFAFGSPIPVGQADFTAFANLCDLAAAQIAIESGRNGLPVGLQIIGPDNGVVLAIAESFENRLRVRN